MSSKSDKKKPLVPSLRFPEFREAGAWEVKRLGDVCVIRTGKKDANEGHENGIYPFFTCAENHIYSNSHSFDCEAILVAGNANVGQTKHYRGKFEAYQRTYVLTDFSDINTQYLYSYLGGNLQNDMALQVQTSAMSYIKLPMLKNYKVPAPRNPTEQQKIAHCLSSLDEVIGLQAKKVQSLKQHKKGLMQQLFPAEGETTPRLRFPEFREAGAWEVKELIKLAGRGTERNQKGKIKRVLTNSAEYGVLDQREYFDKDIAIQGNLENYFVVDQGDFVYNPRISSFAPVGPISRNDVGKGVMSPLYTVFSFRQSDTDFFAHYFNSSAWHSYMRKVGSTGARHDRMAISNSDFLAMPLSVPNPKEQQKIAHCLSSLDEVIGLESHKLDALKNLKKGLMQQLFPQEVA